jgi:hypothetical protein
MAKVTTQVNRVAESCFEFLHIEMVEYFHRQCLTQCGGDTKAAAKQLHAKLESLGFQVGERFAERYSKDQPWFAEQLDIIKFLCKDFWLSVFRKQVDKLQTNHKGIYVLHDNQFRWLQRVSAANNVVELTKPFSAFACGVIRGALSNFGMQATVKADLSKLPQCQFTLVDVQKKRSRANSTFMPSSPGPVPVPRVPNDQSVRSEAINPAPGDEPNAAEISSIPPSAPFPDPTVGVSSPVATSVADLSASDLTRAVEDDRGEIESTLGEEEAPSNDLLNALLDGERVDQAAPIWMNEETKE